MTRWPATLDYPQIWLAGFIVVIWAASILMPSGADLLVAVGWILILAALALMAWPVIHFRRHATTINPHGQPAALISDGPFAWSRNPIYLADVILLVGLSLAWRALPALVLVPLFALIITRRFIIPEEARLAAAFPADYPAYAARVRRWL